MSAFVDTNILVRHLTGDPPELAARAVAYLQAERELLLTDAKMTQPEISLQPVVGAG